jgi:uncharacterized protein with FMN-binding domain
MGTKRSGSGRVATPLVALSSAAVLTIYSAGYLRTRAAADKIQAADRSRMVVPPAPLGAPEHLALPSSASPTTTSVATAPSPIEAAPAPTQTKKAATVDAGSATAADPDPVANTTTPETPVAVTSVAGTPVAATPAAGTSVAATAVPTPTPEPTPTPAPASQYKDGTYSGWGTSRHGDIEATVVIAGGRITSALITQCLTRYSCSWVAHLQGQVVTRQSAEVDYVSGATQSTNAFYYAVVQALSKAK